MIQAKPFRRPFRSMKPGRNGILMHQILRDWAKFFMGLFFMNLRQLPERIVGVARSLQETTEAVEPKFLEIGRTLESLYGAVNGLTRHVNEVTRNLSGTEDENLLGRAEQLAEEARRILERYREKASTSLSPVKTLIAHLETLFSACDQIDRIATNLRVVGINIGVESTRSADAREMFNIVSEEIITFSDSIVSVGEQIREDVLAARLHEEQALNEISTGLSEFQHLSDEASGAIQTSVAEINTCMGFAQDVFDESGRRFEEISQQVGEIVAAVQFHDSMRQRVEHMTSALVDAGHRITEKQNGFGLAGPRVSRLAVVSDIVSIQSVQLKDIIEEIERVHKKGTEAFQVMEKEVALLVQSMANVCDHVSEEGVRDPFSRLVASLKHLLSLVERADKLVSMIEDSIARGADMTARFSRYLDKVEMISVETHIKAINAIIKSDHLGENGRTLEVLAQEMNAISKMTDEFVASVKQKLSHIGDFAQNLQHKSDSIATPGVNSVAPLAESTRMLSRSIGEIVQVQSRMKEQVNAATQEAEQLISYIRHALDGLAFLPDLADEMILHFDRMETAALPLRPFGAGEVIAPDKETDRLATSYTMQRERDVHETFVAGEPGLESGETEFPPASRSGKNDKRYPDRTHAVGAPAKEVACAQIGEDAPSFGDNVELF